MRGASRAALAESVARFDAVTRDLDAGGLARLSDELFAVLHVIDTEHMMRRSLADPSRPSGTKADVARVLFEGKISGEALEIVTHAVAQRWSRPSEMADGFEQLAVLAEVGRCEREGRLDDLEDELFRFGRILEAQPELRDALTTGRVPSERKGELVSSLLAGRSTASAQKLIAEMAAHPRGRSPEKALATIGKVVSDRRQRLVALVRSAVALNQDEKDRLARGLASIYGQDVQIKAEVDPSVLGGLTVQVGDEAIDGTISGRLDRLKRAFEH